MTVFTVVMALAGVVCMAQKAATATSTNTTTIANQAAVSQAQALHDQMNQLEVAGNLDGQVKYFTENVVRMDDDKPTQTGRAAWYASQQAMRASGFKVNSISTQVTGAWVEGNRLYEYGNTSMIITIDGTIIDDPTKYFAVWVLGGANPQIELLIWNSAGSASQSAVAKATAKELRK
jgi:hypothetical protein